jgi:hypothetical protein
MFGPIVKRYAVLSFPRDKAADRGVKRRKPKR